MDGYQWSFWGSGALFGDVRWEEVAKARPRDMKLYTDL